ncbi:MAG: hypothetical protein EHM48_02965 [Planctomycetaceae bacterium]|nr:MAG: hypothetical protein EHM48_02965 [Planctomycetaceae bacterium]
MAEIVYKKIGDLNNATLPLAGTEYVPVSATGETKKALWSGIFGAGWWAKLAAAFTAFKAPDADHADDADTLEGEGASDFHDAAQLTGAIHLDRIPAELTGKNAATATLAEDANTIDGFHAGIGAGKIQPFRGILHDFYTDIQLYNIFSSIIPSVNDIIPLSGSLSGIVLSHAKRISSSAITFYGKYPTVFELETRTVTASSGGTELPCSMFY